MARICWYSRWSGKAGTDNNWNNIDENAFIRGHINTTNYPPEVNQSFLSGIACMYNTDSGWQLASDRSAGSNLYHRKVTNGTWYGWKRILDVDDIYVDNSNASSTKLIAGNIKKYNHKLSTEVTQSTGYIDASQFELFKDFLRSDLKYEKVGEYHYPIVVTESDFEGLFDDGRLYARTFKFEYASLEGFYEW